jgi:hypothetical protein
MKTSVVDCDKDTNVMLPKLKMSCSKGAISNIKFVKNGTKCHYNYACRDIGVYDEETKKYKSVYGDLGSEKRTANGPLGWGQVGYLVHHHPKCGENEHLAEVVLKAEDVPAADLANIPTNLKEAYGKYIYYSYKCRPLKNLDDLNVVESNVKKTNDVVGTYLHHHEHKDDTANLSMFDEIKCDDGALTTFGIRQPVVNGAQPNIFYEYKCSNVEEDESF